MNRVVLAFFLLLSVAGCSYFDNDKTDWGSPKALFVDQISSHTGGIVSVASPIRVRFARNAGDSLAGTPADNLLTFSPAIPGSAHWEDNRTLVYQPEKRLEGARTYKATLDLQKVFSDLNPDKKEYRFVFNTLVQNYNVRVNGLKYHQTEDLEKMTLEGVLQTADVVTTSQLESLITVRQEGENLKITWGEPAEDNSVPFSIENVRRSDEKSTVVLEIDGEQIGVDREEEVGIDVPALGQYQVLSHQVIQGRENYISVVFSDPLDPRQNLNGLVTLSNTSSQPRLVISLNELKIYPTSDFNSNTDLTIHEAIKNAAGYALGERYSATLQFTQAKPEVRLAGDSHSSILPNASERVLPFEAVGLNAVDVTVIRVYEDNILQYLQVNALGDDNQLQRVGSPVARKTIPLNTSGIPNLNNWNRFTLDLKELFETEPGAMYQVRIGFRRQHSVYFCADQENDPEMESMLDDWEDTGEEDSYWDTYENYYSSNYNWSERDNPCSDSYYGGRRSVSKMVMASDLGIIAKRRDGGDLSVFVSNLLDTKAMSGVELEVYNYQQQLIGTGRTGSNGYAEIETSQKPFVLIARKGDQAGYLKLDDGSTLSLSNFNVSGQQVQKGIKGFIYGERGVWRPADTVHLAFMLEDMNVSLPENHPVIMELSNPAGQIVQRQVSTEPVGDIYRFDLVTDREAPTGNWQAMVRVGGATFRKTVRIETIKPNRLKVDLQFDQERFTAADKSITGDLNVRWLSGAKASGLRAEYEMLLTPVNTTFKEFPNFSFDDQASGFSSSREFIYEGTLDSEGMARVNIDLDEIENAPGALMVHLYGKVFEEGGDFSISQTSVPYYPYESFVGVKTPDGDKRGMLLTDQDHSVRIATVDARGNRIDRNNLKVELYKVSWRWWWDNSYDDISNYVGRSYRDPIATGTVSTSGGEGTWTLRVNQPEWGRYYVKVTDPVSGHAAGQVVYLDWPGWAGKGQRGQLDGASMLDFNVAAEEYQVGEKINISIPSTAGNRMLVSLETGSRILDHFWVETEEEKTALTIEATPEMAPNVYVHLTMIQPHEQTANDLPIRLYGVKSVKVVDPATALKPVISMADELRPEQKFTVSISEESGQPMAYTLAVVDEGLLDITNYSTPRPWEIFYAREALGVRTWDVYDDVMGALGGKMDHLLAVGGDGELKPMEEKEANRFKPVVKYIGPFFLEKGATNEHSLTMPQYIGSVKAMVVAAHDGAYGHADKTSKVNQPLMVLATLPRVAGPGEVMKLPVNVFAMKDGLGDVQVTVETSGALDTDGQSSRQTRLAKKGDEVLYFDLKAKERTGYAKVKVTAKSGSLTAHYDIELNVIPRNPPVVSVEDRVLQAGEDWSLNYVPLGIAGENGGSLELSTLPPLNIGKRLNYLIRYPHGCIEQTTSAAFAQLHLDKLTNLSENQKADIQKNISAAIGRMSAFRTEGGGLAYWPGNEFANTWGTNYAGHFLLEARSAGYAVPESLLAGWTRFQTTKANEWGNMSTDNDDDLVQAYRLYTLALAGSPALGAMNRMKESTTIRPEAKWRLAQAYATAGYNDQAKKLIEGVKVQPVSTREQQRRTFGSATRDQAMILETLVALDKKETAFEVLLDLARKMGGEQWMSTQTTAYSFVAISKYAASAKVDEPMNASVKIGPSSVETINSSEFVARQLIASPDESAELQVNNNSNSPVYVRLIRHGIPLEGSEKSEERNLSFSVSYTDQDGNPLDVSALKQGTNFRAQVTVTNPGLRGNYEELALTQLFPAGWEIINTRLDGSQSGTRADYMDIRDDRVMHYFDLAARKSITFDVLLNAAYRGTYYLPAVTAGAMYDDSIYAIKAGEWVEVVE